MDHGRASPAVRGGGRTAQPIGRLRRSFPGLYDREALEKAAKEFLIEKVSSIAPTPAVPLLTVVAEGDTADALITAAKDAQLLVLGTRGRSPLAGLLLGSVSQTCAAAAPCPVVLVKKEDFPQG